MKEIDTYTFWEILKSMKNMSQSQLQTLAVLADENMRILHEKETAIYERTI